MEGVSFGCASEVSVSSATRLYIRGQWQSAIIGCRCHGRKRRTRCAWCYGLRSEATERCKYTSSYNLIGQCRWSVGASLKVSLRSL